MKNLLLLSLLIFLITFLGCHEDEDPLIPPIDTTEIDSTITINLSGYVQKGPFINGTSLIITELDDSLLATGKTFTTQINNNQGSFSLKTNQLEY
ncbi:MAG: hypothetical protein RIG62_25925, partial [Cyclobacteriaceae bacterium]